MNLGFYIVLIVAAFLSWIRPPDLRGEALGSLTVTKYVSGTQGPGFYIELRSDGTFGFCTPDLEGEGTYTESIIEVVLKRTLPSTSTYPPVDIVAVRELIILGDALVDLRSGARFVRTIR